MKVTIGCDPELFAHDGKQIVSAHTLTKGTKDKPVALGRKGHMIQADGFAVEFNAPVVEMDLLDPHSQSLARTQFWNTISHANLNISKLFSKNKLRISNTSLVEIPKDIYDKAPKGTKELGCDPDFNAWTGDVNERPDALTLMRAAGGHVHVGWGEDFDIEDPVHFNTCCELTKQLDFTLGLASVIYDKAGVSRRKYYGKAGAFRPKSYGLEYRALSNYWIFSEMYTKNIISHTAKALKDFLDGNKYEEIYGDIQAAINDGNENFAYNFFNERGVRY